MHQQHRSADERDERWCLICKRRTEAEHQLGPIVAVAREHGLSAPITARLVALIRDIEDGRRAQDWATLDMLMETVPP